MLLNFPPEEMAGFPQQPVAEQDSSQHSCQTAEKQRPGRIFVCCIVSVMSRTVRQPKSLIIIIIIIISSFWDYSQV